ncbi:MAG: DNA polymerase I [Oscillospiraceae bacterium]|nr:DNA polymerase I [Oscillospiraceae bacterium]
MTLMVIDGNSIVNRAFYGVRELNAPDGTPTNAVYGFLNILRRLEKDVEPDAVCVTFDLKAPTFRHLKYEGYKAQRKGMPEELAVQMPILKETLDAMNIRRYELEGWEADDLLGTIAAKSPEDRVVLVTGDRDSFQLIDKHTEVYHIKSRMGQTEVKVYDEAAFREEYGFDPIHIVDLKALMGDSSDNIPGVAGVGEKTAMDLICRFNTIERIYSELETLDIKDSVRKKLENGRESAEMSFDLATIHRDAPIEFNAADCKIKKYDNDALYAVFSRLGFSRFITEFGLKKPENSENNEIRDFSAVITLTELLSDADVQKMVAEIGERECGVAVSADYTTIAIDCENGYIVSDTSPAWESALKALKNVKKVGFSVKDTIKHLDLGDFYFDCELAAYLLDPTAARYELDALCVKYCSFEIMSGADDDGQFSLLEDDIKRRARLLSESAAIMALKEALEKKIEEKGLSEVLFNIEMPLCGVLAKMENAGFLVDKKALSDFGKVLSVEVDRLTSEIYSMAGGEFNINSPKQLGEILFDRLMLPAPKKTKTGYSTNAEVLEKLRPKHPIIGKVLEYRELAKLKSTYADGLGKVIAADGRIHTNFQMTVTATGRLSSTEPNLQNIPVRKELGGEIRKMFIPAEGNVLVDADYSQIELRILAHMSGDEEMRNAFISGMDIHRATAAQVLGKAPEEVTSLERSHAKAVNFGIVYGISAFSLADDIGISVASARDYINAYMTRYKGVAEFMDKSVREAKERGEAVTMYGRIRPLPELKSSNFNLRSFGERVARNMPIQGTAADIMKIAMIRVDRALEASGLDAKLLLQVHDELIVECREEDKEKVSEILRREMEGAASLSVPLIADAKWGKSWFEAK